jgi:EAL domain-containing protein (putative c-di-GMP-specific phosphodiesterase class I)
MESDRDNAVIVRSIIDLGHNLGLKVVAEGVETREANSMLKSFHCDEAQGFYYSRPLPAYAITDFLTARLQEGVQTYPSGGQEEKRLANGKPLQEKY